MRAGISIGELLFKLQGKKAIRCASEEWGNVVYKKEWVMLYPKGRRGKYAFRIEELSEKCYEMLMSLFHGTYSEGGPPRLNVYTEGAHITSNE